MPVTRRSAFNVTYRPEGWVRTRKKFDKVKQGYMTFHSWQKEAYAQLKGTKHWALFAPMGSGKSVEIQALTHHKLSRSPNLRAVISVPQTIIGQSFEEPIGVLTADGKFDCSISHNFFDDHERSVDGLLAFLAGGSGKDISDRTALCSHSAIVLAFKKNPKSFRDVLIVIDETHHAQFVEMDELELMITNGLGALIHHTFKHPERNIHLGISTATFFRGDQYQLFLRSILIILSVMSMPLIGT